jgi:hypothetical protein
MKYYYGLSFADSSTPLRFGPDTECSLFLHSRDVLAVLMHSVIVQGRPDAQERLKRKPRSSLIAAA